MFNPIVLYECHILIERLTLLAKLLKRGFKMPFFVKPGSKWVIIIQ